MTQLELALCNALADSLGHLALCQIELADGKPPEWVQLVPAGAKITALDGRRFTNNTPDAIVRAFTDDPRDLPVDWEHATEYKAPEGEEAPAAAWVDAMEVRDGGAIWGHVKLWTPRGTASIESKEYRYFSPAFAFNKARNIVRIVSAALTNRPALDMPALARHTEDIMDPKLLKLLGLTAEATPEQIAEAFGKYTATAGKVVTELETARAKLTEADAKVEILTAEVKTATDKLAETETELATARSKVPGLEKFVPRVDYDVALARVKRLEDDTAADKAATHAKEVDAEIMVALKVGKIVPASKDFYVATCADAAGLEKFREFMKTAPIVGDPSDLDDKRPPGAGPVALTADETRFIATMGLTEEEYRTGAEDVVA